MVDEFGNKWWATEHSNGTYHVGVHTLLEADWRRTKKAEQQAARAAARICKALSMRSVS